VNLKNDIDSTVFHVVGECADELGMEVCVVGGYVRDLFLKRKSKDIDFVAVGSGIDVAEKVAIALKGNPKVTVYATYGTAQVRWHDLELEFVGARKESYTPESRNPKVESGSLSDDLSRRDFTINAMALSLNKG